MDDDGYDTIAARDRKYFAERKVIEAAKTMNELAKAIERGEDIDDLAYIGAVKRVREAVEALEES